jgi:SagB-type dehydrogenase family enzyme
MRLCDQAPTFTLFWEASKLSPRNARGFAERLEEDARSPGPAAQLIFPDADLPLSGSDERAHWTRTSRRAFGAGPLGAAPLGSLLASVAHRPGGGRLLPSAGATHPVEVFVLGFDVAAPFGGRVCLYQGDRHALQPIAACPSFAQLQPALGLTPEAGSPSLVVLLVGLGARVMRRYGERGGRFLLLEAGHYAQNLLLAAERLNLAAVPLGGTHDDALAALVGLGRAEAQVLYGLAVGVAEPRTQLA